MPAHHEKKILPYTQKQMFDLVADVGRYSEFLPWCSGAHIVERRENGFNADVMVGYGILNETFNSDVTLTPHARIDIDYKNGPFRHLKNYWVFTKNGKDSCEIEFFIDFNFTSPLLNATVGVIFHEAVSSMIGAFEKRAMIIYK